MSMTEGVKNTITRAAEFGDRDRIALLESTMLDVARYYDRLATDLEVVGQQADEIERLARGLVQ